MIFSKLLLIAFFTTGTAAFIAPSTNTFVTRTSLSMSTAEPAIKIDPLTTAFVFIEYQNEFTTEGGALHDAVKECMIATGTIGNSRKTMDAARDAGCVIIHVPIAFEKGHKEIAKNSYGILSGIKEGELFKAGEWGSDFCELMKPAEGDLVCKGKSGLCGFSSTNLDFLLRQNEITNVVLAGFLTNCCIESSMRSAYELGYKVFTLKDCCAATSIAAQDAAYEHTFGMFSVPTTSMEMIDSLKA
jgi:nicotinamidase-related amidase